MSLLTTLNNGIQSATYNPEAEKARKEAAAASNAAMSDYRRLLVNMRNNLTNERKYLAQYVYTAVTVRLDDGFLWIQSNPGTPAEDIKRKSESFLSDIQLIYGLNQQLKALEIAPDYLTALSEDKSTSDEQKTKLKSFKWTVQTFISQKPTPLSPSTDELQRKIAALQDEFTSIMPGKDLYAQNLAESTSALKKEKEQEKINDDSTFSITRLIGNTLNNAINFFNTFLMITLAVVSGMLSANDAIGREWPYRILYFIYGSLFFPIMLLYYLYMWFIGKAPRIYTLLPIRTVQSITSLARFLLFPITYKPDEFSKKAYKDFMTESATLVGKTYTGGSPDDSVDTNTNTEEAPVNVAAAGAAANAAATAAPAAAAAIAATVTGNAAKTTQGILTSLKALDLAQKEGITTTQTKHILDSLKAIDLKGKAT